MQGKKDSFMEVNRLVLSARNRHLQSYTALRSFIPAHRLFTQASAITHCKQRKRNPLPLNWSCREDDTGSPVARDKGRGERGSERGATKMKETCPVSASAWLWATLSCRRAHTCRAQDFGSCGAVARSLPRSFTRNPNYICFSWHIGTKMRDI